MKYLEEVKVGDSVFGLVQGKMTVTFVLPKDRRMDGFCCIEATNEDNKKFNYTEDGWPGWALGNCNCQTLFYEKDIDLSEIDISPSCEVLSEKKIGKLIQKGNLEVRCPSGIWREVDEVPSELLQKIIKKGSLHLFRKMKD